MSIFTKIKDAIFGAKAQASSPGAASPTAADPKVPNSNMPASTPNKPVAAPAPTQTVDVGAVLEGLAAKNPQKLNWRSSIVDLMKLLSLDPSLENRKELAKELGYGGDMNDSATMNVWLHKQVMNRLAAHGGNVPPELKD